MNDKELYCLTCLMMVSDPWPLSEEERLVVVGLLDKESQVRGFVDWVEVYHDLG